MSRIVLGRTTLPLVTALSFALLLTAALGCGRSAPPRHFVLLTVDTLRADHVLSTRAGVALTPNLDHFAQSSVRYSNASSVSTMTAPGVAGFLTGLYPRRSGVTRNTHILQPNITTIAEMLSEAGFTTGGFVANPVVRSGFGFEQGFKEYRLIPKKPPRRFATAQTVNRAATEWLKTVDPMNRIFLWVHYMEPHGPYQPREACADQFIIDRFGEPTEIDLLPPGNNSGFGGIPHYQHTAFDPAPTDGRDYLLRYAAQVRCIDEGIGQILDDLEATGLLEDAVVVITADHGEALLNDNGFYFSHANKLTQDQVAVPLILSAPGIEGGTTVDRAVSTTDILPTVFRLLGLDLPAHVDGADLLDSESHPVFAVRYDEASVRLGEWKLVRTRGSRDARLFNVDEDPDQTTDLAVSRPDIVGSLVPLLNELRRRPALANPISRHELDEETRESLRALGYLTD